MLRTLRSRLILSHVLPLLIVLPLAGLALLYVLETQLVLGSLSKDLAEQAALVAEIARDRANVWQDPKAAQALVDHLNPRLTADIMLLDPNGVMLATTNKTDARLLGQRLNLPELAVARTGQTSVHTVYSPSQQAEIVNVLIPVADPGGQLVGFVRLSHRLTAVYERFERLRLIVGSVILASLLLGAAVGWYLAVSLERPLEQVTQAVDQLAQGRLLEPLPEHGPAEVQVLLQAVNTLVQRLRALEQARRQLLANLVHELGRPLGALQSAVAALRDGASRDSALQHELLTGMDDEIGRLRRLLDDLAHLHGQVLGTLELNRQPTNLDNWLPTVLVPWRAAAQQKGLKWQVNLPADLPDLEIDSDSMARAIGNLVSNAIKYTPAGGSVTVSADHHPAAVWIEIADTGPGIRAEDQARIFEPFYRGRYTTRFPQGMGLGLTIAQSVIIAHGGQITLDSAPGKGSRFTLWLPLNLNRSPMTHTIGSTQDNSSALDS